MGLPYNRALRHEETDEAYDIICGTCFLCGAPADCDNFTDLTPEQMQKYMEYYRQLERFLKIGSHIIVIKEER